MTSLYKTLNFFKLDDIYLLELAKFMYQLHHKKFKTALNDCFVDITKIHCHNTRTKNNLVYFKPRVRKSAGKKSLTYKGFELWGKFEPDVKQLSWLSFKKKIKQKCYPKLYIILTFFASYFEIYHLTVLHCALIFSCDNTSLTK